MNKTKALTERVTVNFSKKQLERLEKFCEEKGEMLASFIRRAAIQLYEIESSE